MEGKLRRFFPFYASVDSLLTERDLSEFNGAGTLSFSYDLDDPLLGCESSAAHSVNWDPGCHHRIVGRAHRNSWPVGVTPNIQFVVVLKPC